MAGVIQSGNWVAKGAPARGRGPARSVAGSDANNPLLNPNQPLSGSALAAAAQTLAGAQVNGPLAALAKQIAANNNQTQGTMKLAGGYYNQLGNQAQQGVTNERGIASDLNNQLQGISNQTNQQLQGLGQSAQDSLMKYAPQGEGGLSTSAMGSLASEIARQKGLAAQQEGASRMFGANQGANYSGLAAVGQGTQALAGTEGLTKIGQSGTVKNQPLMNQVASLNASKGALYSKAVGQLRQQEINNTITRAGLGLKSQSLAQTAAQNAAQNALTAQGQGITLRGQNITQSNDLANQALHAAQLNQKTGYDNASLALKQAALNLKASGKGAKPRLLTPSQQNTIYRNLDEMSTLIRTAQQAGHSAAQIKQALATGQAQKGFPAQSAVFIEAAYELLGWGHVLPQTANAMRGMGLRGGTYRGKPIKVAPAPQSQGLQGVGVGGLSGTLGSIGKALGG